MPPKTMAKVRAQYDFGSTDPDDLPFKKGDVLYVLEKTDDNWWLAANTSGGRGSIPGNYVTVIESFHTDFPAPRRPSVAPTPSAPSSTVSAPVASPAAVPAAPSATVANAPPAPAGGSVSGGDAGVQQAAGRSLSARSDAGGGAPVQRQPSSTAPSASVGGVSVAPVPHDTKKLVKIFSEDGQVKAVLLSPNLHLCSHVVTAALSKFKAMGLHALYEIAPNGAEQLIGDAVDVRAVVARWGDLERDYRLQLKKVAHPPIVATARAVSDRMPSSYDDTALAFRTGDIIQVIRRDDNGTWFGECEGRMGYFPASHVQLL
jgi:hypothetical protein